VSRFSQSRQSGVFLLSAPRHSRPASVTGHGRYVHGVGVRRTGQSDDDNALLEEVEEEDEEATDSDDSGDDEELDVDGLEEEGPEDWDEIRVNAPSPGCVIAPGDADEAVLAAGVDWTAVRSHAAAYSNAEQCDSCGSSLMRKNVFVDGKLRGEVGWGNLCAACFRKRGDGIGWGRGQLYAKQADGRWRMVAGWDG